MSTCQCSMAISMLGDGCRYCQPQTYIEHLLETLEDARAAPVSEAKAQGVVQWPEADEIMQMAFEEGQPADDASGYCFELEEFDLFIERLMSEVARLNAAPAAPAADAGLVEALDYQVLFDAIAAATSVYANGAVNISVQAFRDALAAHSAKGVV